LNRNDVNKKVRTDNARKKPQRILQEGGFGKQGYLWGGGGGGRGGGGVGGAKKRDVRAGGGGGRGGRWKGRRVEESRQGDMTEK